MGHTHKIIIPALIGTSTMTLFSYLVSEAQKRNFREPVVLAQLIERLPFNLLKENTPLAGWSIHYAVGRMFMVFYNKLWSQTIIKPSIPSGALLGAASGLVGIAGWKLVFKAHPHPPVKNLKRFFGHLMLAHIVFGVFCAISYKILSPKH